MPKTRHIPERKCVACGQKAGKRTLTRIVRAPDGAVQADATGKANGRGAYLCAAAACWEKGVRRGGLERSLKTAIPGPQRQTLLAYYREQVAALTALEQ